MGSTAPVSLNFGFDNRGLVPASWVRKITAPVEESMTELIRRLWADDHGQDIAEYAVMLAVILVLVVGTIRLIGGSANNVFSETASAVSQ